MHTTSPTPVEAFAELFKGIERFLPKTLNTDLEPTARWLKRGALFLGHNYGNLLRYNLRLEKGGGDIEGAFPRVHPRATEVERLLRLSEESGHFPKTEKLLQSLKRVVQEAKDTTLEILEERNCRSPKTPASPSSDPWEEIFVLVDDALYGGTVEAGKSACSVLEVEELILPLLYLRHSLFGEPLPVAEVEAELNKLWQTLVKRLAGVSSANSRFRHWLEQFECSWYLKKDPLSGSFWASAVDS